MISAFFASIFSLYIGIINGFDAPDSNTYWEGERNWEQIKDS